MTMRKVLQEIREKNPRFHHLTPLKTKHIAHWCRCHGYTPPDPESLRNDGDSIEDVLTQIDSEPGEPVQPQGSAVLGPGQLQCPILQLRGGSREPELLLTSCHVPLDECCLPARSAQLCRLASMLCWGVRLSIISSLKTPNPPPPSK